MPVTSGIQPLKGLQSVKSRLKEEITQAEAYFTTYGRVDRDRMFGIFALVQAHWPILSYHNRFAATVYRKLKEAQNPAFFYLVYYFGSLFHLCSRAGCSRVCPSTRKFCRKHRKIHASTTYKLLRKLGVSPSICKLCVKYFNATVIDFPPAIFSRHPPPQLLKPPTPHQIQSINMWYR